MLFTNILASVAAFTGFAMAQSDPLPCSGICVNSHDPTLIRRESDGLYFRFSTGGRIPVFTAPEITGPWSEVGTVLDGPAAIDNSGRNDAWAPDVQNVDGTYYLYYSVSDFGTSNSAIGVATSPNMEPGSWQDHGSTGVESQEGGRYNAIDGNLLVTDNAYVFTFGSFWDGIQQTTLTGDALQWFGDEPVQVAQYPETTAVEGPYLFQNGDYYYLFWSQGKCCNYVDERPAPGDEYKIMACRSTSEFGPFEDANGNACTGNGGTLVLGSHGHVYGPGGQGVYRDPSSGDTYLYYHYVDTNVGYDDGQKQLGVNVIDWSSGWPRV
ncbi:hypothetical protein MBLNU230_g3963t1 [Neophaeotheca triangularis]